MMSNADVHLAAYGALERALAAGDRDAAIAEIRSDLEVLDPVDLARVATALAVESALRLTPTGDRPRLRERVEKARLAVMWAAS